MRIADMTTTERGFSILELTLAVALGGLVLSGALTVASSVQKSGDNKVVAADLLQIGRATQHYISQQRAVLLADADLAALNDVDEFTVADLKSSGALPTSVANTNLFGQSYRILIKRVDDDAGGSNDGVTNTDRFIGLVLTSGGTTISNKQGAQITTVIGAAGGFIYSDDTTHIEGNMGNWRETVADWTATNPGAGHLAISTSMLALVAPAGAGAGASVIDDLTDAITDYSKESMYMGEGSGSISTAGSNNLAIGYNALMDGSGSNNTAIGTTALQNAPSAARNTIIGTGAAGSATATSTFNDNTVVGNYGMVNTTNAERNTAIGYGAFAYMGNTATTMVDNTAVGYLAISGVPTANLTTLGLTRGTPQRNTAIGYRTLMQLNKGNDNTAIGANILATTPLRNSNVILTENVLIGHATLSAIDQLAETELTGNTIIGARLFDGTMPNVVAFDYNTIISTSNTSCRFSAALTYQRNVLVGDCGTLNSASDDVIVGESSVLSNGKVHITNNSTVTTLGISAGRAATTVDAQSISIGWAAGPTSGTRNISIGRDANVATGAEYSVAVGAYAGKCDSAGGANSYNVFVGPQAGNGGASCNRDYNTVFGAYNGKGITTGQNNILFGMQSASPWTSGGASGLSTGSNNIIISRENVATSNSSNYLYISSAIRGNVSTRYVVLGGTGTDTVGGTLGGMTLYVPDAGIQAVGYYYISDRSLKTGIRPLTLSAEQLAKLHPVAYVHKTDKRNHLGFIAQDAADVVPEAVTQNGQYMGLDYGSLMAPLTAHIQLNAQQLNARKASMEKATLELDRLVEAAQ
jgi:type II secretory pathway pseudopilin PulG